MCFCKSIIAQCFQVEMNSRKVAKTLLPLGLSSECDRSVTNRTGGRSTQSPVNKVVKGHSLLQWLLYHTLQYMPVSPFMKGCWEHLNVQSVRPKCP